LADPINPNDPRRTTEGAPPTHIHVEKDKSVNWLPWLLLALGILALLWFLLKPKHEVTVTTATQTAASTTAAPVAAPVASSVAATATNAIGGLGDYLKGSDPAPRTFEFDKLHFDTAKSDIRADDAGVLNDVAATLKQYGNVKVRIEGYADARGDAASNQQLGQSRAEAVKAALVKSGIDAGRIEAVSGGASNPAETNATAQGQAENRRTELVVTSR